MNREENEEESSKISINTFTSLTMGDMRRQSFVQSSAERAMYGYGITHLSVFLGDWALKKFGDDSFFKKRFIWIDVNDNTFHWCKVQDRSGPHKRIKFSDVINVRRGSPMYSSFFDGHHPSDLCWSIQFKDGQSIDIKMTDAAKVNDWIRVIQTIIGNYNNTNSYNNNNNTNNTINDNMNNNTNNNNNVNININSNMNVNSQDIEPIDIITS